MPEASRKSTCSFVVLMSVISVSHVREISYGLVIRGRKKYIAHWGGEYSVSVCVVCVVERCVYF